MVSRDMGEMSRSSFNQNQQELSVVSPCLTPPTNAMITEIWVDRKDTLFQGGWIAYNILPVSDNQSGSKMELDPQCKNAS
jgi:hypothetical protein